MAMKSIFPVGHLCIGSPRTFVIAEAGQNHQGDLAMAKKMITAAKAIGADCVKFQKSCLPEKFTASALRRPYNGPNSFGKTYGEHKEFLEFSIEQYAELQSYANEVGILLTASAMDLQSLGELYDLKVPFVKIGSGDTNNFELLEAAMQHPLPLIVSTGMQGEYMLERIVGLMKQWDKRNICILHCVSAYPTEPQHTNLRMIDYLHELYANTVIGYSGHEQGTAITLAAVLLGARVVERHFTLDKHQKGTDHPLSLEPTEFERLIQQIRDIETNAPPTTTSVQTDDNILQRLSQYVAESELDAVKLALKPVNGRELFDCERPCQQKLGKSLVFKNACAAGLRLEATHMCAKVAEPFGCSAERLYEFVGRVLIQDVCADDLVGEMLFESCACP